MTRRYTAFTLIELLVVISIVALLISILLPALKSAREAARVAQCLSNQRQLAIGVSIYENAWKGFMPMARWQADWDATSNPTAKPSYAVFAQNEDIGWKIQISEATGKKLTAKADCNAVLAHGIYRDPSTNVKFDNDINEAYSSVEMLEGGYGWNNTFMGWYYVNTANSVAYSRWSKNIDLMAKPSVSITLGDTFEDQFDGSKFTQLNLGQRAYVTLAQPSKKPEQVSTRHKESGVYSFADGHCTRIPWSENIMGLDGDADYYYRYDK
jgi:prepilin-type N-terminal cleavage/methylation domain-containing protein/prepilin-type processing-associated H-X9-DG protein